MQDAQDSETQEQRELWDDLIVKMEAGDKDAVKEAMVIMRNKVFEFSRRKYGCRLVQKVIETASFAQQKEIANGLRGKVMRTVNHMHANYVMQKFVEQCPQTLTSFVSEEMYGHASQKAKDRSGCRVLLRLLEGSYGPETIILIDELVGHELTEPSPDSELGKLLMHDYAHHVIAKVLETGQAGQKELVLRCFKGDLWAFAKNHRSCYVLEFAVSKEMLFQDGTDEKARQVQEEILNMLVDKTKVREKGKERPLLVAMAMDPYGSYVVRAMLNRPDEFATKAATILRDDFQSLEDRGGKPGHRIIKEMQQLKQRLKDAKEDA